jgi:hypothetical protein
VVSVPDDSARITRLEGAVFGLEGNPEGGLLHAMNDLARKLDRLYFAIVSAALSFAVGAIGVVVAIVATNHG